MTEEKKHYCDVCKCAFTRNYFLTQHYKSKKHSERVNNKDSLFLCVCGKTYLYRQSLELHKKVCSGPQSSDDTPKTIIASTQIASTQITNDINEQLEEMRQQLESQRQVFEEERNSWQKKFDQLLLLKQNKPTPATIIQTTIETQNNIHNNITIQYFGNESMDHVSQKDNLDAICRIYNSIPAIIEKIHFDPKHPENLNIKIPNLKMPYAIVMSEGKNWTTVDRNGAIESMMDKGYYLMDETFTDQGHTLPDRIQNHFKGFQEKYEAGDKEMMKTIKKKVELLIINGTRRGTCTPKPP